MTTDRVWLSSYPEGVPADIDASQYSSLVGLMQDSFAKYADRTAYSFMGKDIGYRETDLKSQALAAYLQSLGLVKGDRVAIMMPNVPQYPVAVAAILRAGLVVVNVNPLYTPRELEHQLKDSGAKAIVIIENFCSTLQKCQEQTQVEHIVLCAMGDMLGWAKGALVNYVVRSVKKWCPIFLCPKPCASMRLCHRAGKQHLPNRSWAPKTSRSCNTPAAPRGCPKAQSCCIAM